MLLAVSASAVAILVAAGVIVASRFIDSDNPCKGQAMTEITREHVDAVVATHMDFFWDYPGVVGFGGGKLLDEDGNETDRIGIIVMAEERPDESEIPEGERMPDCLDGVPIQWEEGVYPRLRGAGK